jgi:hypothetical protein
VQVRQLRARLRDRAALVRLRTACKNRVNAVLADLGYDRRQGLWSRVEQVWLAGPRATTVSRQVVDDCADLEDVLTTKHAALDAEVVCRPRPTRG